MSWLFQHLYDIVVHSNNQFLQGGLVLGLVGSLVALCRKAPLQAWRWFVRRVTVTVDITNDDPLFAWVTLWLSNHPYSKRARALTATTDRDEDGRSEPTPASPKDGKENAPRIILSPAPGNHLILYRSRLFWLERERKETPPGKDADFMSFWKREVFTVRAVSRNQTLVRRFLEECRELAMSRREKKTEVFIGNWDYWQNIGERNPRPLASVFLPEGVAAAVVKDMQTFLAGQEWYVARGIPYRRGYLFHGNPGAGKTSLISALAGHFRMNLYILNLSSASMGDDRLASLISQIPLRSMILLEDIDATFSKRKKSQDVSNKVTFSGLLNALDGAASKDGMMVFMTTNYLERLDSALVRPGRVDYRLEFKAANAYQAAGMFSAFFPEAPGADAFGEFAESAEMTMAEVQQHLIFHQKSSVEALAALPIIKTARAVGAIT